ncbi:helix-turn-helix transcriptional regulator [Streptomyces sp. NBC_01643]|uniref:AraC family transcriptional regulator n=1 Tax=Streptomyces sp. NBC_01643 TaxID=2975906 RepID=UPI00386EA170|nr:helix-turn-helix transcriptional regulator [Streptomyces sp. NBC_01643]
MLVDPWTARRVVGGQLLDEAVHAADTARFEVLHRRTDGVMAWEFKQPTIAVFCFTQGFRRARLAMGTESVDCRIDASAELGIVAAETEVQGYFQTGPDCSYSILFLDPELLPKGRSVQKSLTTFDEPGLRMEFREMRNCAEISPDLAPLMLEGWALRTLARLAGASDVHQVIGSPRLSPNFMKDLDNYIEHSMSGPLTVGDMAAVVGYSARHFTRALVAATGMTPTRYLTKRRIERGRLLLRDSAMPITEVAHLCGFANPQHFATVFRRATGTSPSDFARAVRPLR